MFGRRPVIFITINNYHSSVVIEKAHQEPPTDELKDLEDELKKDFKKMNQGFARLSTAVAALATVEAGVKTTVQHMADQIRALGDAPTTDELNALADQLESTKDQIAQDIVSGTAAEDETPVDPTEIPTVPVTDGSDSPRAGAGDEG